LSKSLIGTTRQRPFEWECVDWLAWSLFSIKQQDRWGESPIGTIVQWKCMKACITRWWCLKWFSVDFHARCINMHMSLNEIEHMYTVPTGLHIMIYVVFCLDVLICLCFPESCGVHVYEYNWDIWCTNMYSIDEFICVCF